jgi:uncharacterized protein
MAKPVRKIKKILRSVSKVIKKAVAKPARKKAAKAPVRPKRTATKKAAKAPVRKTPVRKRSSALKKTPGTVVAPETPARIAESRLPQQYGDDKLVILARDPWWLYAYWEVTPGRRQDVETQARKAGKRDWTTVLRIYDVSRHGPSRPDSFFDIELHFITDNWYVDVGIPDRRWMAELGLRTPDGKFFALVRSNVIGTPSFGLSPVLDEEWMLPEDVYLKIIGLTGPNAQSGSTDIRKMLEKYLKRVVSSESSPRSPLTR